jgi:Ni,Fe-hydrogenase maturation factor
MKILVLGNEFIQEDSLAKEIAKELSNQNKIINIKDSFQFLDEIQDKKKEIIVIDVVQGLNQVKTLEVSDLGESKILTAHDMDASFFLQLLNPDIKIIGIPQTTKNKQEILKQIQSHLTFKK